jgi:dipeptidase D
MEIKDLKPAAVWQYFDRITRVPRPSKHEEKMVKFIEDFARQYKLDVRTDAAGNVIVAKPATAGLENLRTVILQSHIDMVCEKNADVKFDFATDAIKAYIDGGWVKARGTTLGADDGIGVAASLALLASTDIPHGPLRCLFTTDEETGLTGAYALGADFLDGGDILINLDSEEWGEFCIGCAGGKNTAGTFHYKPVAAPADYYWFEVKVGGLKGGHSGSDIHLGRGNANKILTRYLWTLAQDYPMLIGTIDGGNLHNAIPREARAIAGIPNIHKEEAAAWLNILIENLKNELAGVDDEVSLTITTAPAPRRCIDPASGCNLLNALYAMPHGVIGMSRDIAGLVETSTNLASMKMTEGDTVTVTTSQRSSTDSLKTDVGNQVKAVFEACGATVSASEGYPGWKPNPASAILKVSREVFQHLTGDEPRVIAIHAGLECGLFFEKNPALDMISCGPTLYGVHSPDERIEIDTVGKWWDFLLALLKAIPQKA